jgi:hypothetical protein
MYTLPTGRIVNSLKNWSFLYPALYRIEDHRGLTPSIPISPPTQRNDPEQTAETEHRRSFS